MACPVDIIDVCFTLAILRMLFNSIEPVTVGTGNPDDRTDSLMGRQMAEVGEQGWCGGHKGPKVFRSDRVCYRGLYQAGPV